MKNIKYILFIIIAFVIISPSKSNAQYGNEVFLSYNFAIPLPDSKDYISNISYMGGEVNLKHFVSRNSSVSFSIGWNIFYQETSDLIVLPNADVSGKQNRYINTLPMLVGAQYYFGKKDIKPYAGINLGTLYSTKRLQIGVYDVTENHWRLMLQPEAGVIFNLNGYSDVALGVTYNYCFPASTSITGKDLSESWLGIKIGYGWKQGF
jgi:hypothetical protein